MYHFVVMELEKVIFGLNSKLRLNILKVLCEKDMSAPEILSKLKQNPLYRQYVNRELEILKDCLLVSKYYDDKEKKLLYHIENKEITIDIIQLKIKN